MKNLKIKLFTALLTVFVCLASSQLVFAANTNTEATTATESTTVSSNSDTSLSNSESSDLSYLFSSNTSGNANLIASQEIIADNSKYQFIAVTTRDKDVFYIIIDKMKSENNVYFLNEVDTYDLHKLLNKDSDDTYENSVANDINNTSSDSDNSETNDDKKQENTDADSSANNMNLLMIIGVIVLAVIGFVIFKIKKGGIGKKKQTEINDDFDDDFDSEEEINEDKENTK